MKICIKPARLIGLGVTLAWTAPEVAWAAPVAQANSASAFDRRAIVEKIVATVEANFAFPEKREAVISKLRVSLASGQYDTDDHSFAVRVSEDLMAASGDKHMYLVDDAVQQQALSNSPKAADETISAPGGVSAARFKKENYGLVEQRILAGNVRYLNITAFDWTEGVAGRAYDDAIRFLRDGEAIIIDLRQNLGGTPEAVRYLLSYFVAPNELLATFYEGQKVTELRALQKVAAGRIIGKPVYVLTSQITASAAEELAYYVANHHLGEVIGERTAGAGNIKGDFPIAPGFVLSVSVARSIDPFTHSNWEGVGVTPSDPTTVAAALTVAHVHALERIFATADAREKRALTLDLRLARARADPVILSPEKLAVYAGSYGDRRIRVDQGGLRWKRGEQAELTMEALGDDWFQLGETGNQAHFQIAAGHAISVFVSRPDGDGTPISRTPM